MSRSKTEDAAAEEEAVVVPVADSEDAEDAGLEEAIPEEEMVVKGQIEP